MKQFDDIDSMENALRRALRKEEPSAGFAERLMARAAAQDIRTPATTWYSRLGEWFQVRALPARAAVAFALTVAIVAGVRYESVRRERLEGEAAKRQLLLALRVTGSTLHSVQSRVREASEIDANRE
jgi:hypothetical protein